MSLEAVAFLGAGVPSAAGEFKISVGPVSR
jgi:hypothetical protein